MFRPLALLRSAIVAALALGAFCVLSGCEKRSAENTRAPENLNEVLAQLNRPSPTKQKTLSTASTHSRGMLKSNLEEFTASEPELPTANTNSDRRGVVNPEPTSSTIATNATNPNSYRAYVLLLVDGEANDSKAFVATYDQLREQFAPDGQVFFGIYSPKNKGRASRDEIRKLTSSATPVLYCPKVARDFINTPTPAFVLIDGQSGERRIISSESETGIIEPWIELFIKS